MGLSNRFRVILFWVYLWLICSNVLDGNGVGTTLLGTGMASNIVFGGIQVLCVWKRCLNFDLSLEWHHSNSIRQDVQCQSVKVWGSVTYTEKSHLLALKAIVASSTYVSPLATRIYTLSTRRTISYFVPRPRPYVAHEHAPSRCHRNPACYSGPLDHQTCCQSEISGMWWNAGCSAVTQLQLPQVNFGARLIWHGWL